MNTLPIRSAFGAALFAALALCLGLLSAGRAEAATSDVVLSGASQTYESIRLGPADLVQTYTAKFTNTGASPETVLLDLEAYNSWGPRIGQKFEERTILPGQTIELSLPVKFEPTWQEAGTYTFRVGVFAPGWASLAHWYNRAAATAVARADGWTEPVGTGDVRLVSATLEKTTMAQCGKLQATATFETDAKLSQPVIIDFEYWKIGHKGGQSVWHNVVVYEGSPVTKTTFLIDGCNPPADYVWKIGIFKPGWTEVLHWYDNVGEFTITDPSLPATGVRGDVSVESSSLSGSTLVANLVLGSGDYQKVLVNAELYNASGVKVHQEYKQNIFFDANSAHQAHQFTVPSTLPPGTYTWKIGVFEGLWQKLLHWYDDAGTFTIGG